MTGNEGSSGVLVQPRDLTLMKELAAMRLIDREQAKVVAGFGSTTRANARLLALTRAGLLRRYFTGSIAGGRKAIYALSREGAALVGAPFRVLHRQADHTLAGDLFLQHQQAINNVYLAAKFQSISSGGSLLHWHVFYQQLSKTVPLTPDAYLEIRGPEGIRPMFLEVDLGTEALKIWRSKVRSYLDLAISGEFSRLFQRPQFRVLVVTNSERRGESIRTFVSEITDKIFWFTNMDAINRGGVWSAIWLRPRSDQCQPLL